MFSRMWRDNLAFEGNTLQDLGLYQKKVFQVGGVSLPLSRIPYESDFTN